MCLGVVFPEIPFWVMFGSVNLWSLSGPILVNFCSSAVIFLCSRNVQFEKDTLIPSTIPPNILNSYEWEYLEPNSISKFPGHFTSSYCSLSSRNCTCKMLTTAETAAEVFTGLEVSLVSLVTFSPHVLLTGKFDTDIRRYYKSSHYFRDLLSVDLTKINSKLHLYQQNLWTCV